MNITIKPNILITMRKNRHIPVSILAEKLKISKEEYLSYESEPREVTIEEASKIAKIYKRNWSLFLLESPPEKPNFGQDHRTKDNKEAGIGYLTYDALEEANYLLDFVTSIAEDKTNKIPKFDTTDKPKDMAKKFRDILKISLEDLDKLPSTADATKFWIKKLGTIGINISTHKLGDDDGIRAFSIFRDFKAAIVLNSEETDNGKLFSLMHEVGHILIRNTGVCDLHRDSIESFCNEFASQVLIPSETFDLLLERHKVNAENAAITSQTLARSLGVSRLAVLTRMLTTKIIGTTLYDTLSSEEYRKFYIQKQQKRKRQKDSSVKPIINPYVVRKARLGNLFLGDILQAYHQSKITPFEASNYLGFKPQTIGKFNEWVGTHEG